jgi:hypothetical protein
MSLADVISLSTLDNNNIYERSFKEPIEGRLPTIVLVDPTPQIQLAQAAPERRTASQRDESLIVVADRAQDGESRPTGRQNVLGGRSAYPLGCARAPGGGC